LYDPAEIQGQLVLQMVQPLTLARLSIHYVRQLDQEIPEFLDEFRKTSEDIGSIFMEPLAVFFVFIGWIDNGDFWEFVHWWSVGFVSLARGD
jgi:hypothetical protein